MPSLLLHVCQLMADHSISRWSLHVLHVDVVRHVEMVLRFAVSQLLPELDESQKFDIVVIISLLRFKCMLLIYNM